MYSRYTNVASYFSPIALETQIACGIYLVVAIFYSGRMCVRIFVHVVVTRRPSIQLARVRFPANLETYCSVKAKVVPHLYY